MAQTNKHLALALGATFLAGAGAQIAQAEGNPFGAEPLASGYEITATDKDHHGEGKCGEGKCGEGKCGEEKGGEGKCGEGKCGEGSCGGA